MEESKWMSTRLTCVVMLHNKLPIPVSTSVTGQNVLTRAMGYTSALAFVCVFYLLVRLNIDLIFFSKWWAREIRCRGATK